MTVYSWNTIYEFGQHAHIRNTTKILLFLNILHTASDVKRKPS